MIAKRSISSLRWRLSFLSIALFVIFYFGAISQNADSLTSGGQILYHHSRSLLQADQDGEPAVDGDSSAGDEQEGTAGAEGEELEPVEEEEEQVEELVCGAEKNNTEDPLFPPNTFSDNQMKNGAVVLYILGVLYMFYALALVCDHFFVPSLDVMIEKFDISPDVAGATLMAAGGSAPELFTSLIGVFIAISDVGIGTIVGSAVFNVLFVIAACAFASAEALSLTAWPLVRDTAFYSVALMLLVGFFTDNVIKWWEALILFLWYGAYVGFMKFNVMAEKKFLDIFPSLKGKDEESGGAEGGGNALDLKAGFKYYPNRRPLLEIMQGKVSGSHVPVMTEMVDMQGGIQGLKKQLETNSDGGEKTDETEKLNKSTEENDEETEKTDASAKKDPENGDASAAGENGAENGEEPYEDVVLAGPQGSWLSKIVWCITMPLMIPLWVTVPNPNDPKRRKYYAVTFVASILWIMVYSYLMVWWATVICQFANMSDTIMGLTFLAAGTSVPDLITSVLVAKQGHGDMAVSSSIGSNIFDVTVGLPVPWLLYTIAFQTDMKVNSTGLGCNIGMLFAMLLLVFLSILVFKWRMTKAMGGIMFVLYAVFVVFSVGLSSCWFSCDF